MKISYNWLRTYIDVALSPEELATKLTMRGLEVEGMERLGEEFNGFVIGEVLERVKHPNADKLTVCKVNDGKEIRQIVCGAPNVAAGQKVIVGLPGAMIPHNQHDPEGKPFTLGRVKIRGVESSGMICSEYELGLGSDADGIMVLDGNAQVGMALAEYLGLQDVVYEIAITANRPDCLSHIGVAREVATIVERPIRKPEGVVSESGEDIFRHAAVEILDAENCPRYSARVIRNVNIGLSPLWMQNALKSVGLRPINNIVDITNYVLMETGHPLHAFDYDNLVDHKIIVRCASADEIFVTLDEKERTLRVDSLLICDGARGVALAGVMGGMNSEITNTTRNVLLESAYFNPRSIRRTSKHLGLSTDASYRFERGVDPNGTIVAINRAAQLMHELAGGEILRGIIDVYPTKIEHSRVSLRVSRTNSLLGTTLTKEQIISFLSFLDITLLEANGDALLFDVPTFRPDIEREIDLIEEVARVYGYDNIESKTRISINVASSGSTADFHDEVRNYLVGSGFKEVVTNSMLPKETTSLFSNQLVEVLNPISNDMVSLRPSLLPGILGVIQHNQHHGVNDIKIYEIGNVFSMNNDAEIPKLVENYLEEERLILALTGRADPDSWDIPKRQWDFFDLKGEVETLFSKIFLDNYKFIYYSSHKAISEVELGVEIQSTYAGSLLKVSPTLLKRFDIEGDVFVCELDLGLLKRGQRTARKYTPLPKFPSVTRDIAVVVEKGISIGHLEEEIRRSGGDLLKQVRLFDVYEGERIEEGKKSVAFSLELLSLEQTLTEEAIEAVVRKITTNLNHKFQAVLRS
jgi:phenylalanyl-tRNA synthetase beta chain